MSTSVRDLLMRGAGAARDGNKDEARFYLEKALNLDPDYQQKRDALMWLAKVEDNPAQKRAYVEEVLATTPFDIEARRMLAIIDGRLDEEDIVNADSLRQHGKSGPSLCPECGGPLVFSSDGHTRQCERCHWHSGLATVPSENPDKLLQKGIAAVKANDHHNAQQLLQALTKHTEASKEQKTQAWLWLSGVSSGYREKRACMEAILRLDPENAVARRGLSHLNAHAPAEDAAETSADDTTQPDNEAPALSSRRFICSQCGGKMSFAASGSRLECGYCGNKQTLMATMQAGGVVEEQDFSVTLATEKGHSRPVDITPFKCQGCNASFLLAPGVLSLTCPYCGSAHVIETRSETRIPPEGILPFTVDYKTARKAYRQWLTKRDKQKAFRSTDISGVYLPIWTFDIGGVLGWVCTIVVRRNKQTTTYQKSGDYPIDYDDILVPASHTLPIDLIKEVDEFDLSAVVPYDARYLADWPSELYSITLSNASLVARQRAQQRAEHRVYIRVDAVKGYNERVRDVQINTSNMAVYAYKLILLPFWIAHYRDTDDVYHVVINGQTGNVRGQEKEGLFKKLLGGLLGT